MQNTMTRKRAETRDEKARSATATFAHPQSRAVAAVLAGAPLPGAVAMLASALEDAGGPGSLCRVLLTATAAEMMLCHKVDPPLALRLEGEIARVKGAVSQTVEITALDAADVSSPVDLDRSIDKLRSLVGGHRAALRLSVQDASGRACGLVILNVRHLPEDNASLVDEVRRCSDTLSLLLSLAATTRSAAKADKSLADLAASIPGVVYQRAVRPDGKIRYTYISDSAHDLFGVTAEKILTDPEALFQHYSPDYRNSFRQKLLKASQDLSLWDVEAEIHRPDGQKRYTHAIARPQREADGSVLWTGVILDQTRIKEAELSANAAEARTRAAIVESLSQGLLLFDRNDQLSLRNSHFFSLYPDMEAVATIGASYADVLKAELDPAQNPSISIPDAKQEFVDRLMRHGEPHLVYEREMQGDRHILVNEYRTPDEETVVLYTDISELKRRERKIEHLAHHDSLTGLANRVLFRETLETTLLQNAQNGDTVAVICLDLDRFKTVNDTLGHHVGDLLLKEVAERLQACLREGDVAARLGGDEFAVILQNMNSAERLTSMSWRLLNAMAQPFALGGHSIVSGTSIGIAVCNPAAESLDHETLLRNADLALYRAKSDGRGTFRFFEREMDEKAQARRLMEIALRGAIIRKELEVHYQPLVDAHTSEVVGAEALLRWNRPGFGYVPPLEFVPLAEETGLIAEIGEWVLQTACADAVSWNSDVRVAVNISPAQFRDLDFADKVAEFLKAAGLPSERLELEITESMLLRNTDANLKILHALKTLGIRISMDDFGTGYSSLGNLRSFPFSKIKIDKSFINDLSKSADAAAIIRAVLALGRSLGMTTTAEGVETRDQLAYLRAEGCVEMQGHYFAKAIPSEEFALFCNGRPQR